ncbi:LIM domain only protein 7 isoform X3 [Macrosteles quadrilineatus]|uniref:LIM domain only protein 7 isoform X3 n=1 Tax=Macrosteles quadrilineatus TaxID=74068 RepID=UPI0023E19A8E|nr:LIM domain only protein 7 isoform X3 [Macrosteles quadrilineatus]
MPAVQPATAMSQRRHSSASSDTGSDHGLASPSRHTSQENIAIIPTRTTKVVASKPAANPLQFVKVGPCDLSRYAQEQLKKAEEVKKVKPERRDEAEDWQSNLDNWKVSRRKRQEHIIERVVEVKKLELEEHDRNRRRSKTFNEMLEERTSKGRKTSLPVYKDDDNDLSDLGLSTQKNRENGDDNVFDDCKSTSTSRDNLSSTSSSVANGENGNSVNGHHDEEYTYDRAIQNYVNYTESRIRGRSLTPSEDNSNLSNGLAKKSSPPVPAKPRRGSCKIEEKLTELEQIKKKSMSTNDLSENSRKPLSLPKVDISKRKEMFEKTQDEDMSNSKTRLSGDFGSTKSIRDRVTSFSKASEDSQANKKLNRISGEISVKDRLSSIERQNSTEQNSTSPKSNSAVNGTPITQSVKDRLSSLQKSSVNQAKPATVQSQVTKEKLKVKEEPITKTVKKDDLVSNSENNQINRVKENNSKNINHSYTNGTTKEDEVSDNMEEKSTSSPSDEMYESKRQQHYRHRSLDSLDVDSNDGVGNESFERVQSLEDLDYCRNYPPSSVSGDTDREDSGIHTADVSSSVSQADDCDLHLDGEFHQQPTILEEINKNSELTSSLIVKQISQMNKFEGIVSEGGHHLTALSVDIGDKQTLMATDSMAVFSQTDSKLIEDIEVVFPLSPSTLEPPKEKPPPPPMETSDDDDQNTTNIDKPVLLRRLDSTKRIKKEIRQKRSSFLGIEGSNDDNYLEPELELVRRPPDISSFLAEEKRLEQQLLYRQSICSESESRDSGVELEKHNDDLTWTTMHHSRDNSETYANLSTTSEEEEIVKKEREILEMLEREEINRYNSTSQEQDNIGEKLAVRLRELEAEKSRLEWEREEESRRRLAEEAARQQHQSRIQARELQLCKQEQAQDVQELDLNTEMLIAERKRLEAEQASLARQRDLMLQQYNHNHNRSLTDVRVLETGYAGDYRRSMTDLRAPDQVVSTYRPPQIPETPCDNRRSMPDLAARRPPPPIPPAKPLIIPRTQDKRMSSPQQMTRQTLQALAAAPKSRLSDNWLQQPRRNPKPNNYQHWLVQEAEQRRITEMHQRQAPPPRRPVPPPPPQQQWAGGSPQYTNWQPPQPRQDKPLPDAIIQSLTQRVQNRLGDPNNNRRRMEVVPPPAPVVESRNHNHTVVESRNHNHTVVDSRNQNHNHTAAAESQEKMLSVSGKKKCSHCGEELGRGAAMIIESLRLFYHIDCFKCCVCCVQLGDGLMGTDVRVRNNKLHCHNCYSSDDGVKFSCV